MDVKFKVGDVVRPKYDKQVKIFIVEVETQRCYAGEQVFYAGRIFSKHYVDKTYSKFSQIELEPLPEPSAELKAMRAQLEKLNIEKYAYVKSEDWDMAAQKRNEINRLKVKMNVIYEEPIHCCLS